ncbi:hypothetical protein FISHEDRAFT_38043 [Fistulina hepatica ATCC 64428]|nr:hypothetical protein FISHEDRAFT_38043 [Fistulina hepatica ATCC 64428]
MYYVLTPCLTFASFVLLLLVSLSLPIINRIWLFRLNGSVSEKVLGVSADADTSVTFGVWGYCTSAVTLSGATTGMSSSTISTVTSSALVLHPIACGIVFATMISSLFMFVKRHERAASICTLVWAALSATITTAAFLVDIIFCALVKLNMKNDTDGDITVKYGNINWMVLAAMIALWVCVVTLSIGVCGCTRCNRYVAAL